MVFIFGIDIPLIELMLVSIAFFIIVLFLVIVNLLWINRKEYQIIKTAENIIEEEHEFHGVKHPAAKPVKEAGLLSKIVKKWNVFWEAQKKESEQKWELRRKEMLARKEEQQKAGEEKAKIEAERKKKLEEERKAVFEKQKKEQKKQELEMKPLVFVQPEKAVKESWWENHKKEVAEEKKEKTPVVKGPSLFKQWNGFWKSQRVEARKSWSKQPIKEKAIEIKVPVNKGPSIFKRLNRFWVTQKKEAEKTWFERHKEEVAKKERVRQIQKVKAKKSKGPSFFAGWNKFWGKRKQEAEKTWQQRYNVETKKALQTSKNKSNSYWNRQKQVAEKSWQPKKENKPITKLAPPPKPHNIETWWQKHKKAVAQKEEKSRDNIFSRWNKYWNEQKKTAEKWRKK